MRLPDEQDERGMSAPVIYTIVAVSALILIILACVLFSNSQRRLTTNYHTAAKTAADTETLEEPEETVEFAEGQSEIERLYKENKLRAEDLDFWDMYDYKEAQSQPTPTEKPTPTPTHEPTDEEKAADGRHVQVSYMDGTTEWLEIDEDIPLHSYDFTKMKAKNGKMAYYEGNKRLSRLGVTLSKESGSVDFEALREAGVDFVMLKVGGRGYETGLISADESFAANIEAAQKAGLEVGVYFSSQAVSVTEATEEANFVAGQLLSYKITYPVAFRMDSITNDTARTDILGQEQKTQIAEAFLNTIKREGYSVVIYGDKGWLLTEVLSKELLNNYDVWLTEQSPVPDYPYQFKMWEYAAGETIEGVEKEVSYTISFVDYAQR